MGRILIGRKSFINLGADIFGSGITKLIFQGSGKQFFSIQKLKIWVIPDEISGKMILMNFMGMWSIPVAFDLIDVIAFITSISRTDVSEFKWICIDYRVRKH